MTIQRESIKIKYGKTLNMGDYNSVVMHIEETYLVPDTIDFDARAFIIMKAKEFEDIIDEKLQPEDKVDPQKEATTVAKKYPQTAKTEKKPAFRIDNKGQEKYECPGCHKMDRLKTLKQCYNCYIELKK